MIFFVKLVLKIDKTRKIPHVRTRVCFGPPPSDDWLMCISKDWTASIHNTINSCQSDKIHDNFFPLVSTRALRVSHFDRDFLHQSIHDSVLVQPFLFYIKGLGRHATSLVRGKSLLES